MTDAARETIQQAYIRVCRDSRFNLEYDRAAALAAGMLGIHPLEVWCAFSSMETVQRIAVGDHPAVTP